MNTEQLKTLAVRLAALADALDERSRQAVHSVAASSERLEQTAQNLSHHGQRLTQEAAHAMGARARDAVEHGMQQAFDRCTQELQQVANQATHTAQALHTQGEALRLAQRGMVWKASLGLVVGAVLAVGSSGFWFWKSMQAVRHAEFSESVMRATQTGTLTQCGRLLCVKAPRNASRYDKNSDYVLLP